MTVDSSRLYNVRVFQLSAELIDQLIYAMEDQQKEFRIHLETGEIVRLEEAGIRPGPWIEIPVWRPIDGYNLMEKFNLTLRNPILRERLREALSSGKGVFRGFKNALKEHPEMERLWYLFKGREMKKAIYDWYDDQRELVGLEKLGPEPEEVEELVLEDFLFREAEECHLEGLLALDLEVFREGRPDAPAERVEEVYRRSRMSLPHPLDGASLVLVAETPRGDLVGFAWGVEDADPYTLEPRLLLVQLAVAPRMRGLGLGAMLLEQFLEGVRERGCGAVRVELSGGFLAAGRLFEERGFTVAARTLELDLARWERERVRRGPLPGAGPG